MSFLNSLLNFLKKHFINILINIVFFVVFFSIFSSSDYFVMDGRADIVIDPLNTLKDFFYTWNDNLLGSSYAGIQSYIFPIAFVYAALSFVFNICTTQAIFYAFFMWLSFFFFYLFAKNELRSDSRLIYIGSFFYAVNLYVILNISQLYYVLVLPFLVLPLQLYFFRKLLFSHNWFKYSILVGFSTLLMGGVNPPLIAINLIVLCLYFFCKLKEILINQRFVLVCRRIFVSLLLTFVLNLFWVFGLINFFLSSVNFSDALSEPIAQKNKISTYLNVFRMIGSGSFFDSWAGKPYFSFANSYNSIFLVFSMYFFPVLLLLYFSIKKQKNILFPFLLVIVSVPMVVASREGFFARFYEWAYSNLPLFSMFRTNTKFFQPYILGVCMLLSLVLINVKNKRLKIFLVITSIFFICLNAFPFFNDTVIPSNYRIKEIPHEYYDAGKFFNNDNSYYRIMLLPVQYFPVYSWGQTSGNPEILWGKSLVVNRPGSPEGVSNKLSKELSDALMNKDYDLAEYYFKLLKVKYVVQRNDFDWKYYQSISQSPEIVQDVLSYYEKVGTFGNLDVYLVDNDCGDVIDGNISNVRKVNSTKYYIFMDNIKNGGSINFSVMYDKNWALYLQKNDNSELFSKNGFGFFSDFISSLLFINYDIDFKEFHSSDNGYGNKWAIDEQYIKNNFPSDYYVLNDDGSIDLKLVLVFKPQIYFGISFLISIVCLLLCIAYLLFEPLKSLIKKYFKGNDF